MNKNRQRRPVSNIQHSCEPVATCRSAQFSTFHLSESAMAPTYKIIYFNVTALGESCRMLLKYANIDFEDERIETDDWPNHKAKMPFGQMPILVINGKQYHQSLAMARYCAKQAKLVGKDDLEDLEIESIVETINDLRLKIALYSYEKDEAIKASRKAPLFEETIPYYLERIDKIAKENGGHLAVNRLTWADIYLTSILDYINFMIEGDLLEKYSNLQKVRDTVLAIPQIKKWIEERPKGWC
ncbi:glutathione S-transferase-like [Atheta coriaria]|uniref:glutathione S-transferase-like n=1 Tax=Dalotia coriaria TaxID=877792 RepID=UPI0031F360DB